MGVFSKKAVWAVAVVLAAAAAARAQVRVAAVAGTVEVQQAAGAAWQPAIVGAEVPEGGSIRTSGDGRVELQYPNDSRIWMQENASITIETQRSLLSRVSLLFGSIKATVPKLGRSRRMEFKTATAVAAVRGTELVIRQNQDGQYDLNVLFGKVELRVSGLPKPVDVSQGMGYLVDQVGQSGNMRLLTRGEEVRGLESWSPGLSEGERLEGLKQKEENRMLMREFSRSEEDRRGRLNDMIGRQKEEDIAAGRTLIDVHGNLTRVDQRIMRPNPNELQIVNLVKRPVWNYTQRAGSWEYFGATTINNRLDSGQIRFQFANALPEEIANWPNFFADNEPTRMETILANQTNPLHIYEIAFVDADGAGEAQQTRLFVGHVNCQGSGNPNDCLAGMRDYNNAAFFDAYDQTPTSIVRNRNAQVPEGEMRDLVATHWGDSDDIGHVFLTQENILINAEGGARSVGDFTDTTEDPFSVLSNTAFQTILMVKNPTGGEQPDIGTLGTNDRFCGAGACNGTNEHLIDLVVAPDALIGLMLKVGTEIENLKAD